MKNKNFLSHLKTKLFNLFFLKPTNIYYFNYPLEKKVYSKNL